MTDEDLFIAYEKCFNGILLSDLSSKNKSELFECLRNFLNPEIYEMNKIQVQNMVDSKELGLIKKPKQKIMIEGVTVDLNEFYK